MATLISGGAEGADKLFEHYAGVFHHKINIYKANDVTKESIEYLDTYLKYLNNKYLNRSYPTRNEYVNNLLRRDVLVGIAAEVMFAVTTLDKNFNIVGGTAWACYTFIDKYKEGLIPLYLFDQKVCRWFQPHVTLTINKVMITYVPISSTPTLSQGIFPDGPQVISSGSGGPQGISSGGPKNPLRIFRYAGIGTRELNQAGKDAIKNLYFPTS
jgi:hypothetical protein